MRSGRPPNSDTMVFFRRSFPSANMVLIRGEEPVLVDTGFGSDVAETASLLERAGVAPHRLGLIVNTHHHSDHVGGNHALQKRYGVPVAAHRWEAALVNHRDAEACSAVWLDQPVEPYRVDRLLFEGDEICAGELTFRVLHTPGHTLGHISLYEAKAQALICGDAVHGDDVAWLNLFREGAGALERAMASVARLSSLPLRWACSGHGAAIHDPQAAFAAALRRYESWLNQPERVAWHGLKRIFAYALMLKNGLAEEDLEPYLLSCPWFHDYSRHAFGLLPADFVAPLLAEMLRSGAAAWQEGRLVALAPHRPPPPGWPFGPVKPKDWPGTLGG